MAKVRTKSRRLKRKSIRKTRRSRMSTMSRIGGSDDHDDLIVNEHEFYVYLGSERKDIKGKDIAQYADKIKKWFASMAADHDDEYYEVDIQHIKDNKFTGSYKYYKDDRSMTPKEYFTEFLERDEKYPIYIGEKDYTVYASLNEDYWKR